MSDKKALDTLRSIGAEEISRRTHIARHNVERLVAEDFSAFAPVQLSGFIRILEREYGVDLSSWKIAASTQKREVSAGTESAKPKQANDPFAHAAKSRRRQQYVAWTFAALLAVAIAVTVAVLGGGHGKAKIELNNTAIDKARENLASLAVSSRRSTLEAVETIQRQHQEEASSSSEAVVYEDVVIRPRTKVWLGVIDAQTHKRYTRTTAQPWELDGNRSWLIVTGHGLLSIECGGVNASFAQRDRLLFLYEDGKCREIDAQEFRARNGGRIW